MVKSLVTLHCSTTQAQRDNEYVLTIVELETYPVTE